MAGQARIIEVSEAADPRLGDYVGLTDAARRRAVEEGTEGRPGVFIAEGALAVSQLVRSRYPVRSLLLAPERVDRLAPLVPPATTVFVAAHPVLAEVTGYPVHRGILGSGQRLPLPDPSVVLAGGRVVLVLAGVNDHENVGALFRNAAAFGAGGVLLDPTCADPLYRRSIRVSLGHVLHVPYARVDDWPGGLGQLRKAGFTLVALTPRPATPGLRQAGLSGRRVALLLGAEGAGLDDKVLGVADQCRRIPLAEGVDSLNVATAAAIALYEVAGEPS